MTNEINILKKNGFTHSAVYDAWVKPIDDNYEVVLVDYTEGLEFVEGFTPQLGQPLTVATIERGQIICGNRFDTLEVALFEIEFTDADTLRKGHI